MREPGEPKQRSLPVGLLQGHPATTPARVALVIFAHYQAGARWNPQPISRGLAVLELMRHSIPVQRTPRRVMAALTAMVDGATAWSSARGEADAVAHSLLHSLESAQTPKCQTPRQEEVLPG